MCGSDIGVIMKTSPPFASIENEFLRVDYLTTTGPRIIGLYAKEAGIDLFAKTPQAHWPTPHGEYYLHGGHRLWTAPEDPLYLCPEDSLSAVAESNSVILRSGVDAACFEKEISFQLDENCVRLTHRVHLAWQRSDRAGTLGYHTNAIGRHGNPAAVSFRWITAKS